MATSRRAAPSPRGTRRRVSQPSSGEMTAATTAAAMTGITIVWVSDRITTAPTTKSATPTASHADSPRWRSHGGGAKRPLSSRGSNGAGPFASSTDGVARRERRIAREALAREHDVGPDALVLDRPQLPGPADAALDLVRDEEDAVAHTQFLQ